MAGVLLLATYLADCDAQHGEVPSALSDATAREFAADLRVLGRDLSLSP